MVDFIQTALMVLIGIYSFGALARQNQKIDRFVGTLEINYSKLNAWLSNVDIQKALTSIQKAMGWLAFITAIIVGVSARQLEAASTSRTLIVSLFLLFTLQWMSLKWCLNHEDALRELSPGVFYIILGPTLMGLLVEFADPQLALLFKELFSAIALSNAIALPFEIPDSPIVIGIFTSCLILLALFIIYYPLMWIIATPIALLTILMLAAPVKFAQFIHTIAPKKPFAGFVICLFISLSFWMKFGGA